MESYNHFSKIATELDNLQAKVVSKTCVDLEAAMKARIRANGQIDTGFMANSVYTRLYASSTYAQVGAPPKGAQALPEAPKPASNKTGYVAVAASYGIYQDQGTRYQAGRPFVQPAIDAVTPGFEQALAAIESKLGAIR